VLASCAKPGTAAGGLWLSESELNALPTSGPAWDQVRSAASGWPGGQAVLSSNDSTHDVDTMAAALVAARTDDGALRSRVCATVESLPGAGLSRALELGRSLPGYVIAADLTGCAIDEPWLRSVLTRPLQGHSGGGNLLETAQRSANNWGAMARAAVSAAAAFLDDGALLAEMGRAHREYAGEAVSPERLQYTDTSWHADPADKAGINRPGATIGGQDVSGVIPEDQRRTGEFAWPPPCGNYPFGGLQGEVTAAVILDRAGAVSFRAGSNALVRAAAWLYGHGCPATGDDRFVTPLLNRLGGSSFPVDPSAGPGKVAAWSAWTHG